MKRKIIEILLLYGTEVEDFEDLVLKENDKNRGQGSEQYNHCYQPKDEG